MSDSGALRSRRFRAHQAGDHSLCVPGRCNALLGELVIETASPGLYDEAWEVEQATRAFVATLALAEGDPRAILAETAIVLAMKVDHGDVRAARELSRCLGQIAITRASGVADRQHPPANPVDQLWLRREALARARGWPALGETGAGV